MEDKLRFIDLFAGIGGFRLALENLGMKCVFSAEIDEHACKMYEENFGDNPYCDITKVNPKDIPDFDILCAGFPCQSFSICGKQKGFIDKTRGTLFFDIVRILNEKKPRAFILENVKNLTTHDNGKTLTVIIDTLIQIGYSVNYKVLNAKDYGVPQNRERIIIVGNLDGIFFDFDKLLISPTKPMKYYLDQTGDFEYLQPEEYTILGSDLVKQQSNSGLIFIGYRNKPIRKTGVRPNTEHLSRVHKQTNRIYSSDGTHPTLASQETNGRYWIYDKNKVRKLTINECYRFMGFPDNFKKIGASTNLYERIGNSVCVQVIRAVGIEIKNQIFERNEKMNLENPSQFLEKLYQDANKLDNIDAIGLSNDQKKLVETVVNCEESNKGVYTVLVSSLTYKVINPSQDVRYHKKELPNGYSGRTFDTKYVTPFLKEKRFLGAMKESGWLTRSLEQLHPFTLDFPGRINKRDLKEAFLKIMKEINEDSTTSLAYNYLKSIFVLSLIEKQKKTVTIINPVDKESNIPISEILNLLHNHFYYRYSSRGASILPVIAFYSIYECMIKHFDRFKGKKLDKLASHNSCDRSSGETGDIVVRDKESNEIYEVVEIKFDIVPDMLMVQDAYDKFKSKNQIQRYYILSTKHAEEEEIQKMNHYIDQCYKEHGCQIIINGVFDSLKYYLRLLTNTDEFLEFYTKNLQENTELDYEHKISWNRIIENNDK